MYNLLRVVTLVVVALSSVGAAHAIDWTGFYAGVHGGAGVLKSDTNLDPTAVLSDPLHAVGSGYGLIGGGQIGYLHDTGTVVLGVELSGSIGNASSVGTLDTTIVGFPILFEEQVTVGPQGQLVATLGFEPVDGWLIKTGGGVEVAKLGLEGTASSSFGVIEYGSDAVSFGPVLVAGIETAVSEQVSIFARGSVAWHGFDSEVHDPFTPDVHTDVVSYRIVGGLNFHF